MLGHAINSRFVRFINMSNNTLKYLFAVILPLIVGQLFVSCKQGNPEVGASLDRIEQVVQQRPDSALFELNRLDSLIDSGAVSIEGDRQMARYALLKTQTHDKNWIDDTNDSLILRAVRYYDEHGSRREQMLAHFYHGAIFRNATDYGAAFVAYRQAEQLALELDDDHYLSLIYGNLSALSYETYSNDAFSYGHNSLKYARLSNNNRQTYSIRADLARSYSARLFYDTAEIWFRQVIDSLPASDPIVQSCLTSYIEQCVNTGKFHLADSLLSLLNTVIQPVDLLNKACLFQMKGDQDSVKYYIQLAEQNIKYPEQQVFYFEKLSWIAEMKGDFATALSFKKKRLHAQNKIITDIYSKSVSDYQRDFEQQQKELAEYRYAEYKRRTILASALSLLLIGGGIAYTIKKKRERQHIIETYMENVSDMQRTLLENTDAIATLQHKAEAMDSERLAKEETYRNQIKSLFAKSFHELESLYKKYYQFQNEQGIQREIYKDVCDRINAFAQATQQEELDHLIDENFDHAMEKVKSPEFELSDKELQLYKYKVAGLSARTIRMLMHIESQDALQKRQQRLRKKILESNSPFATELASLMG